MNNDGQVLHLRDEIPKRRYDLIFDTFADLAPGASYALVSDDYPSRSTMRSRPRATSASMSGST